MALQLRGSATKDRTLPGKKKNYTNSSNNSIRLKVLIGN